MNDQHIEQAIIDAGANVAPRVSADQIDTLMGSLRYESWVVPDTTTTVVVAILPNGFTVGLGKSASVSKANFNPKIGFDIAKAEADKNARDKLWELEGYALSKALLAKEEAK